MSGGGGGGSQTTQTEPWDSEKPYLQGIYSEAKQLYHDTNTDPLQVGQDPAARLSLAQDYLGFDPTQAGAAYGGGGLGAAITSGQAGFNPTQLAGQQALLGLAGSPQSPLYGLSGMGAAQQLLDPLGAQGRQAAGYYGSVLGGNSAPGQLLQQTATQGNSNPYLDAQYQAMVRPATQAFMTSVMPGIEGNFAKSGRYGSDAMAFNEQTAADSFGRSLSDSAANLYGNAYENDANRRLQAQGQLASLYGQAAGGLGAIGDAANQSQLRAGALGSSVADSQYANQLQHLGLYGQVGDSQQAMQQALADRVGQLYGLQQQNPLSMLGFYQGMVTGGPNYSAMSGPAVSGNKVATTAGGALSGAVGGAEMGSAVAPGYGTAIGGILGALLGGAGGYYAG
jgi:hypothetical protein